MLGRVVRGLGRLLGREVGRTGEISITWIQEGSDAWLVNWLGGRALIGLEQTALSRAIELRAAKTDELGPKPLWNQYPSQRDGQATRYWSSDQVRTAELAGRFYSQLAEARKPDVVIEFGTAFGVSGMYWLAGLELAGHGELLTFDPNETWATIARENLKSISSRFTSTIGTFEDNIGECLGSDRLIGLAFIDGIHTREFVLPQLEIVIEHAETGAIIVIDDIDFDDDMMKCWQDISRDPRFSASFKLGERVGVLELKRR